MFKISEKEYEERRERIKEKLAENNLDVLYLSDVCRIFYTTGYPYIPWKRPFVLLIPVEGEPTIIVPKNESTHVRERVPWLEDVVTYWEYPPVMGPIKVVEETLKERGYYNKRIGMDNTALPSIPSYLDVSVEQKLKDVKFLPAKDIVDDLRQIKSEREVELIKEAAKWGNLAHTLLQEYIEPGVSEIEVTSKATHDATVIMLKALGSKYETYDLETYSAYARIKAGPRTAFTHGLLANRKMRNGDVIESTAFSKIGNYQNHMERTMILGRPTERQKKYFNLMVDAQTAAIEKCWPGVKVSDVHKTARQVIKKAGLDPDILMHHRTGRGIGLTGYEKPIIVDGDDTTLRVGMICTIEPGIYLPGECCFRHCDTIIIAEDGPVDIDYYPRDLESLTILERLRLPVN